MDKDESSIGRFINGGDYDEVRRDGKNEEYKNGYEDGFQDGYKNAKEKDDESGIKWIPIKWLEDYNVYIAKILNRYKSTDDGGETWRDSTDEEIKAWGYEDD